MAKLTKAFLELRNDVKALSSTSDDNTEIGREALGSLMELEASISDWLPKLDLLSERRQTDLLISLTDLRNGLAEDLQLLAQLIETSTIKVVDGLDRLGRQTLTANIVGAILQNRANDPNRRVHDNWVLLFNVIIAKHNENRSITIQSLRNTLVSAGVNGEQADAMLKQILEYQILLPASDSQDSILELDSANCTFKWMKEELDQGHLPILTGLDRD